MNGKVRAGDLVVMLAHMAFVLLFPGFFFYHYMVGTGLIPPVLGGYFGVLSLALVLPLLLVSLKRSFAKANTILYVYYAILILILVVSSLNYAFLVPHGYVDEMYTWSLGGVLFNLVSFYIAMNMELHRADRKIYLFLLTAMFVVVILNVGQYGIFYIRYESGELAASVATYQGFARSIVALLLLLTAMTFQRGPVFYLVFAIGLVALFFNGARTEFVLYVLSFVFLFLVYSTVSFRRALAFMLFLSLSISVLYMVVDYLPESRMLKLANIAESSSAQSRFEKFEYGVNQVVEKPLFGNYGSYTQLGGVGSYPHNILSAWVNLGLSGFLLYVALFVLLWFEAYKGFVAGYRHWIEYKVFLIFLVYVTSALLVSKDYSYLLTGLMMGFYYKYAVTRRVA